MGTVTWPEPAPPPAPLPDARFGFAALGAPLEMTAVCSGTHIATSKRLPLISTVVLRRTRGSASSPDVAGATFSKFLLEQGYRVLGISRSAVSSPTALLISDPQISSGFRFEQININSDLKELETLLDIEKPEYIFDFAGQGMVAESWAHPEQWLQTNLISKTKLLEILRQKSWLKRYIRASTPEVYGSHHEKISETSNSTMMLSMVFFRTVIGKYISPDDIPRILVQ
jgi:dTDP-glucose 4,6-dehydratase